ncbi:MAG: spore cortex biosynthesis protein YabQ [Bacillota bacterium]
MLSLAGQLVLVGRVALAGAALAAVWDLYRSFKGLIGVRRSAVVFVMDLLLLSLLGPVAFWLLLLADGAQMRLFTLVGLALGIAAYRMTLSPVVVYLVWASGAAVASLVRAVLGTWWWIIRRSRPWGVP